MWEEYKRINPSADSYEAWCFGGTTPEMPNELARLVLEGEKTGTAGAHIAYEYENAPLPVVGGYNIVLSTENEAICIIKTTRVYTVPFSQVTAEHAHKEGEGDRSLQYWREGHEQFFTSELSTIGKTFSTDMLVVCEEFELVYPIK